MVVALVSFDNNTTSNIMRRGGVQRARTSEGNHRELQQRHSPVERD
jgi:hypothetical protein